MARHESGSGPTLRMGLRISSQVQQAADVLGGDGGVFGVGEVPDVGEPDDVAGSHELDCGVRVGAA